MEFGYGRRREGYYCEEDRDREDSSSNNHLILIPSSSSATLLHRSFGATASSTNSTTTAEAAPVAAIEKEHMFDKVVTPSDVGKLNRLVIPKQHAERYFPLDASANEKGLHLNFEDRTGKPWRFRYSYWNSSQSYVMTKGWSRFVKEKRLNAGDTVSFARGVGDSGKGRMFIDWKRRPDIREPPLLQTRNPFSMLPSSSSSITYPMVSFSRSAGPWGSPRLLVPNAPAATLYNQHQQMSYGYSNAFSPTAFSSGSGSGQYYPAFRSAQMQPAPGADATFGGMPMVLDSVPVVHSRQAAAKRVRLFGVNLDFQESDRQHSPQNAVSSQPGTAESSRIFSSSSSSPSASAKEEELSLDLDM